MRRSGDRAREQAAGGAEAAARRYGEALRAGDARAAQAAVDELLAAGMPALWAQSRVIAPAMRWIGELWARGELEIEGEHLATAISHQVLAALYPRLLRSSPRPDDVVVMAAAEGERHLLGLRMAADVLDAAGHDVRFLGCDRTAEELLELVDSERPAAVALSATMPDSGAALLGQVATLRARHPGVRLIVGGQGVPPELRHARGVVYAASSERLAAAAAAGWPERPGALPLVAPPAGSRQRPFARDEAGSDDALAARLAEAAAAAADVARREARRAFRLELLALRDPLTGLWNRRAFDERHEELIAARPEAPPAVLMIDVDRFKAVNDRLGHDAGDRVLVAVADCIRRAVRPDDVVARYGGDEFAVLLPEVPPETASLVGERIRSAVAGRLTDPPVTVSVGVGAPGRGDRRRAILEADRALYRAKRTGRDLVAVSTAP